MKPSRFFGANQLRERRGAAMTGSVYNTRAPPSRGGARRAFSVAPLHRVHDGRAGGELRVAPVGALREDRFGGGEAAVRGLDALWRAALGRDLRGVQEQTPRLDDRAVGGAEVLAAPIDDGAHGLLYRAVLDVDAVDAGEALGL